MVKDDYSLVGNNVVEYGIYGIPTSSIGRALDLLARRPQFKPQQRQYLFLLQLYRATQHPLTDPKGLWQQLSSRTVDNIYIWELNDYFRDYKVYLMNLNIRFNMAVYTLCHFESYTEILLTELCSNLIKIWAFKTFLKILKIYCLKIKKKKVLQL